MENGNSGQGFDLDDPCHVLYSLNRWDVNLRIRHSAKEIGNEFLVMGQLQLLKTHIFVRSSDGE